MKELMHSVRAQLIAGYVAALMLLGVTAIGAATGASSVSHDFVQALRTDEVLTDIILLRTKLVDDKLIEVATGLHEPLSARKMAS